MKVGFWGVLAVLSLAVWARVDVPTGDPAKAPKRVIVLALDAVPFETVVAVRDAGRAGGPLLDGLRGPSALVSTFPSSTSLAMGGILEPVGLAPSLGYEARFFDRQRNRLRGGGLISYNKDRLKFGWRTIWDWKAGNVRKMTAGLRPIRASIRAIEDALDAFMAGDDALFLAYCDATDLVGHLRSPAALEIVLARLDAILAAVRARHPDQPFVTVLFSDHGQDGGAPLVNVRKPVRRALEAAGLHLAKRVEGAHDVVLVPYGLLSSIVAYTEPSSARRAAEVMATVPGVDFCVAPVEGASDRWHVAEADGAAEITRRMDRGGTVWRYAAEQSDPLDYARLGAGDAWRSDAWWFQKTRGHIYPDALHRIARGFDLVENPASVLCSLDADAMYGAAFTNATSRVTVGKLHWTHGAMRQASSLGFLMTDLPGWQPPAAVRFDEALKPVVAYVERSNHGH